MKETVSIKHASKRTLAMWRAEVTDEELADVERLRPRTRAECEGGARPCPFVGCKYNLYLEVKDRTGAIVYRFPSKQPEDMPADASCVLDLADRGGMSLEDIAHTYGVSREMVRQMLDKSEQHFRNAPGADLVEEHADEGAVIPRQSASEASTFPSQRGYGRKNVTQEVGADSEFEPAPEYVPTDLWRRGWGSPTPISLAMAAEGQHSEELVTSAVWRIYLEDSAARGFETSTTVTPDWVHAVSHGELPESQKYVSGRRYIETPDDYDPLKPRRRGRQRGSKNRPKMTGISQPHMKEAIMSTEMTDRMRMVLAYIEAHPGESQQSIADALKIGQTTVSRDMIALREMGKLGPPSRGPGSQKKERPQAGRAAPAVRQKEEAEIAAGDADLGELTKKAIRKSRKKKPIVNQAMTTRKSSNGHASNGNLDDAVQALRDELLKLEMQADGIRTAIAVLERRL